MLKVSLNILYLINSLQFYTDSFESSLVFGHCLKICMLFGYNPQIIYCYFFSKLNLVIIQALYVTK